MPYHLPTFNLRCNIWHDQDPLGGPPTAAPDLANVPCNLQFAKKIHFEGGSIMFLLVPKGTDIRDSTTSSGNLVDIVEVPAGSQRWYYSWMVDDVSKGFPTEYRCAQIDKAYKIAQWQSYPGWLWPTPYP